LIGGLWFLQGVGLVHVQPILCFADCEPVQGPSTTWSISGLVLVALGVLAIFYWLRRRTRP
jgi:hypothetical protein